jgi:hypothetical protein
MTVSDDLKHHIFEVVEHLPDSALAEVATYVEFVATKHARALDIDNSALAPDPTAFADLLQIGQELARDWPAGVQSADALSAMRDER